MTNEEALEKMKSTGLTSREIASKIDVNYRLVQRWKAGKRRISAFYHAKIEQLAKSPGV